MELLSAERCKAIVSYFIPEGGILQAWPLKGGISSQMTALEVLLPSGAAQKLILRQASACAVKQNPHALRDEFKLLQHLVSLDFPVPKALHFDGSCSLWPTPYMLLEYIEGKMEFAPTDIESYIVQFADHLAAIHNLDSLHQGLAFMPSPALSPQNKNHPRLLHGDFWPANTLWQSGQLIAVIDWEDAKIGDPLEDLAISRLDILCMFGVEALQSFTRQYQSKIDLDYTDLAHWDLCAARRMQQMINGDFESWASFFHPFGRPDISGDIFSQSLDWFKNQASQITK